MSRAPFTFADLAADCAVSTGAHLLDGRALGAIVQVPIELHTCYPYSASAYAFLQCLRGEIFELGTIEFPGLPVNRTNHTLAQRAPRQHAYSDNAFLTDYCQSPHQDTPPYPSAFWLGAPRRHFASWVVSTRGLAAWAAWLRHHPASGVEAAHRALVDASLAEGWGLLLNREPGLLLLDNSEAQSLYHARSWRSASQVDAETPLYAYNEMGLLHMIDRIDSRRGPQDRCPRDERAVRAFLAREGVPAAGH
jgi:hypothetical protein